MKVTFTQDGGFEIDFTEAELSAQYTIPESAYAEICNVAKERMHITKEICVKSMEYNKDIAIHNMDCNMRYVIENNMFTLQNFPNEDSNFNPSKL